MKRESFVLKLYKAKNTVFTIDEIALLLRESDRDALKSKINYYVKQGVIKSVRKGIYVKSDYNVLELATKIYTPAYISLETVLEKEGVIFQHYKTIFAASYLSRKIEVDKNEIRFRKIKKEILINKAGVIEKDNYFIATKERAFLDALYLYKDYYFDNLDILDKKKISSLLKIYRSGKFSKKVKKILKDA